MATQHDTVQSGSAFRDKLYALSNTGEFSDAERDGFSRLHAFFSDRLASFQISPRYGNDSPYYDNPKHWSDEGLKVADNCKPSIPASQQATYDAANNGGDALETVTGVPGGNGLLNRFSTAASGLQGSLLLRGDS